MVERQQDEGPHTSRQNVMLPNNVCLFVVCQQVYHIARDLWSSLETRTVKNVCAPAAVIEDKIYIIGGERNEWLLHHIMNVGISIFTFCVLLKDLKGGVLFLRLFYMFYMCFYMEINSFLGNYSKRFGTLLNNSQTVHLCLAGR